MPSGTSTVEGSVTRRPRETLQRDRRLFLRWRKLHDERARDELVVCYMPLAESLARRFEQRRSVYGDSREDCLQVARIGLLKAIDRFDPERGFAFTSFATPTIMGELKRHKRDFGWPVHVPRRVRDDAVRVASAGRALETSLGRPPRVHELAEACDLENERVVEALDARRAAAPASLDSVAASDDGGFDHSAWAAVEDGGFELVEARDGMGRRLRSMSRRDRLILQLRLIEGRSQREIAEEVGISQMHVSRLVRKLIKEAMEASWGSAPESDTEHRRPMAWS